MRTYLISNMETAEAAEVDIQVAVEVLRQQRRPSSGCSGPDSRGGPPVAVEVLTAQEALQWLWRVWGYLWRV